MEGMWEERVRPKDGRRKLTGRDRTGRIQKKG
jgi:hypothetical protein